MAESKLSNKSFRYCLGKKNCTVSTVTSTTVLHALLKDRDFEKIYKTKFGQDLIIQRRKPNSPAINENFPCCLIENDEVLDIRFIKRSQKLVTETCDKDLQLRNPEELMIFSVKTTGRTGIQHVIMKNKNIRKEVDCVCVVALKGETVKAALRRDGRFLKSLFTKDIALEDDEKNITKMKNSVDELKDKVYSIALNSPEVMPDSLEMQNDLDDIDDLSPSTYKAASRQHSMISKDQSLGNTSLPYDKKEMTNTMKSKSTIKMKIVKNLPNTQEIYKILCSQFDSLVQQLKDREKLKNFTQVQQLLREEFSKESQCFSHIKTVKKLMELSGSVCHIRHNNDARGTGFLLFDGFILTNAHVVTHEGRLLDDLSVTFDFEDFTANKRVYTLKRKPVAYEYVSTQHHNIDFALMELVASPEELPSPLLKHYGPSPARGGVCIIGHPDSGVKRMDSCLIIERANQEQAVQKCITDNPEYFQVISEAYFDTKQRLDGSQTEYNSCFFYGSSGSPVFDEHCNVVGMHTGGYVNKRVKLPFTSIIEYALPLLPILVSILRQTKEKRKHVWYSFMNEKNTKLVMQLAENKNYRPDLKEVCVWDALFPDDGDTEEGGLECHSHTNPENYHRSNLKRRREEDEDEDDKEETFLDLCT